MVVNPTMPPKQSKIDSPGLRSIKFWIFISDKVHEFIRHQLPENGQFETKQSFFFSNITLRMLKNDKAGVDKGNIKQAR